MMKAQKETWSKSGAMNTFLPKTNGLFGAPSNQNSVTLATKLLCGATMLGRGEWIFDTVTFTTAEPTTIFPSTHALTFLLNTFSPTLQEAPLLCTVGCVFLAQTKQREKQRFSHAQLFVSLL